MKGKKWTDEETALAYNSVLNGVSLSELAKKFNRTEVAIMLKVQRMNRASGSKHFAKRTFNQTHIEPPKNQRQNYMMWRKHPRYTNYYVSDTGEVWSAISGRILKQFHLNIDKTNKKGLWVSITRDGQLGKQTKVSRLVAEAWLKDFTPEMCVIHKDLNRDNNDISNLIVSTQSWCGRKTGHLSKAKMVARYINDRPIEAYRSARACARAIGVNYQTVLDQVNGSTKKRSSHKHDLRWYTPKKKVRVSE